MATSALPQFYIADTPDVQAAKAEFARAWNAAAARNAVPVGPVAPVAPYASVAPIAPVAPVAVAAGLFEDGETYPEALPYVHEEIAAEPYIHIAGPEAPAAPVAPVAPVAPIIANTPIAYSATTGGCYNYKGEGVPCRY